MLSHSLHSCHSQVSTAWQVVQPLPRAWGWVRHGCRSALNLHPQLGSAVAQQVVALPCCGDWDVQPCGIPAYAVWPAERVSPHSMCVGLSWPCSPLRNLTLRNPLLITLCPAHPCCCPSSAVCSQIMALPNSWQQAFLDAHDSPEPGAARTWPQPPVLFVHMTRDTHTAARVKQSVELRHSKVNEGGWGA